MLRLVARSSLRLVAVAILLVSCGDDTAATTASSTTTGAGGSTSSASEASSSASTGGAGGFGDYVPTLADIEFTAVNPVPSGEHVLFNDWNGDPNSVWAVSLDGMELTEIFRAYRVWSMGLSTAGDRIAFACGDRQQKLHFGIDVGDAIQHSFVYDVASQNASLVAHGNINDECHTFSHDDASLYVCRRANFTADGSNDGYRLGRIDLSDDSFTFLTDVNSAVAALYPAPLVDGSALLYTEAPVPTGQRALVQIPLPPTGMQTLVRQNVNEPVLSPDGTRYVFTDYGDGGSLHASDLDGANEITVSSEKANGARWSPDGTRIVYLVYDDAKNCSHIDMVAADGSDAAAPTRIYDCGAMGAFVTDVAFIDRP